MEKLSKQFAEWGIKWEISRRFDEFFVARLRLTFYYSITAVVILGGSSIILYNVILSNLSQSILEEGILNPLVYQVIINRAQDILFNRFLTIDVILIFFIVILGFLLTHKTLEPIESNMQKQKRFIADASHDLRTPIAVIISGLEVNLNNKKLDLAGARKTLEDTLEEMKEFSKLSNNLLDISKSDLQKEEERETILINALVKSIVEKNKSLARVKNIKIETRLEISATVVGNEIELGRVFFNVLDNAIKYTAPNGTISLSDKIISNQYVVTINDNGIGMAKDIVDKVFDPFFRGDFARNTEGAGLGLTLSKKIIENHQGTIAIKSEANKGTSVTIALLISS